MRILSFAKLRISGLLVAVALLAQTFAGVGISAASAAPAPIGSAAQVDVNCGTVAAPVSCTTSSLVNSNTTRKLAVTSNGTIFALFYGPEGIRVAKSTDRGATFGVAVQVSATNAEAELAASSSDNLYVVWSSGSTAYFSKSTDLGTTWSAPISLTKSTSGTVHMAVDGDYVYLITNRGSNFWVSSDAGATFSNGTSTFGSWAFSDVLVDPLTHKVYAFVDNPSVSWFVSTDRGATFSSANATGKSVYYSVAAISSSTTATYMYMAGSGTNLEKVDILNSPYSVTSLTVDSTVNSQGRSLAADGYGNVVSGVVGASGALTFQVSNDFGASFGTSQTLLSSGTNTRANVAINQTNGDLMFLYQNGNDIFFQAYSGYLVGYDLALSLSTVSLGYPGEVKSLVLTNSGTTSLTFSTIALSNAVFTQTNTCTGALAPGASCTVSITGSTAGDANLQITATNGSGSVSRAVPVTLGAIAAGSSGSNSPAVACIGHDFVIDKRPIVSTEGQVVKLSGTNLDGIETVSVAGQSAKVVAQSQTEIAIEFPPLPEGFPEILVTGKCGQVTHQALIEVAKPYQYKRTQVVTVFVKQRVSLASLREVRNTYLVSRSANLLRCVANVAVDATSKEIDLATTRITKMCNGVITYARHIHSATVKITQELPAGSKTVMLVTFDRDPNG